MQTETIKYREKERKRGQRQMENYAALVIVCFTIVRAL